MRSGQNPSMGVALLVLLLALEQPSRGHSMHINGHSSDLLARLIGRAKDSANESTWLQCAKVSWNECLRRNYGLDKGSVVWCPICVYYECENASQTGRVPYDKPDPYFDTIEVHLTNSTPAGGR